MTHHGLKIEVCCPLSFRYSMSFFGAAMFVFLWS